MTVKSALISVRKIQAGESVGYGRGFVSEKEMMVGVIAFGYGDGYPRAAGTDTPVLTIPSVGAETYGTYSCRISNTCSELMTNDALVLDNSSRIKAY